MRAVANALKDEKIGRLQHDPAIVKLIEQAARPVLPRLELLRDGAIIAGRVCRLTIGSLALCQVAGCRVFCGRREPQQVEPVDILEVLYFLAEENWDEAVWLADQPERRRKTLRRWIAQFRWFGGRAAIAQTADWLARTADGMPQRASEHGPGRAQWWVDAVDSIVSEYHWAEEFVLWRLPLARAAHYVEAMAGRKNGQGVLEDISENTMKLLDAAEAALKK